MKWEGMNEEVCNIHFFLGKGDNLDIIQKKESEGCSFSH